MDCIFNNCKFNKLNNFNNENDENNQSYSIFPTIIFASIYILNEFLNKLKKNNYYIKQSKYIHTLKKTKIYTILDFNFTNIILFGMYMIYNNFVYIIYIYKLLILYTYVQSIPKINVTYYYISNLLLFPLIYFASNISYIKVISSIAIIFTDIQF
jgi:hypothetical protein